MAARTFRNGDLVWAKLSGYRPWPGKVVEPPEGEHKANQCYIYFFRSSNFSWIKLDHMYPYFENLQKFSKKPSSASFREALKLINEDYHESHDEMEASGSNADDRSMPMALQEGIKQEIMEVEPSGSAAGDKSMPVTLQGGIKQEIMEQAPESNDQSSQQMDYEKYALETLGVTIKEEPKEEEPESSDQMSPKSDYRKYAFDTLGFDIKEEPEEFEEGATAGSSSVSRNGFKESKNKKDIITKELMIKIRRCDECPDLQKLMADGKVMETGKV